MRAPLIAAKAETIGRTIDTYLCDGAELQVTLPDKESKAFKKRAAQALKKVAVTSDMFDKISRIAYAQVRDDIFKRFKLSDQAAELAILRPQLCTGADDQPQSNTTVQRELRRLLSELQAAHPSRDIDAMDVSALTGLGLQEMLGWIVKRLPES